MADFIVTEIADGNETIKYVTANRNNNTIDLIALAESYKAIAKAGRGDDIIIGSDLIDDSSVYGGRGNDTYFAKSATNLFKAGSGDDTLVAGAGSDKFYGQSGRDTARFELATSGDGTDYYDGGRHNDTLILAFTADEWQNNDALRSDVQAYSQLLAAQSLGSDWQGGRKATYYEFSFADLTVTRFENLIVLVDDQQINLFNVAPEAQDDSASVDENATVNIDVLRNDTDADADILTVASAYADNGQVAVEDDGSLTYSPNAGFYGSDIITYAVADGNGGTSVAQVSVTIASTNAAPVVSDQSFSTYENSTEWIAPLSASDPDGDPMMFSIIDGNELGGFRIDENTGAITIADSTVLDHEARQSIELTVQASDPEGATDLAVVTISLINVNDNAPDAIGETATTTEDTSVNIDLLANDSDADGDGLTIKSAVAEFGSVVIEPNGTVTYAADTNYSGSDIIRYVVTDGVHDSEAEATVSIHAVADAPTLSAPASISVDPSQGEFDLDTLVAELTDNDGSENIVISFSGLPEGVQVVHAQQQGQITDIGMNFVGLTNGFSLQVPPQTADFGLTVEVNAVESGSVLDESSRSAAASASIAVAVVQPDDGTDVNGDLGNVIIQAPDLIHIQTGDGSGGFVINGAAGGDKSGVSVSDAGDVNGDGYDDIIVGAMDASPNGVRYAGSSYLIYGGPDGLTNGTINLADIENGDGSLGFAINGTYSRDKAGYSVSSAGDFNGDGFADILIGAKGLDGVATDSGASYILFGGAVSAASVIDLGDIHAGHVDGLALYGDGSYANTGYSVSSAGDMNGDGFDDVIVGSPYHAANGTSYVIFGTNQRTGNYLTMPDIASDIDTRGFVINAGVNASYNGWSVASAGDVNGDGFADVIIGDLFDSSAGTYAGASHIVFGRADLNGTAVNLQNIADGGEPNGFSIFGSAGNVLSGTSVSSAGDVNGDGIDDLIIGAVGQNTRLGVTGAGFVVYGQSGTDQVSMNLSDISNGDGSKGFVINGVVDDSNTGVSVASAGDINGDGFADVIVGATLNDADGAGASYVVYGGSGDLTGGDGAIELIDIGNGVANFGIKFSGIGVNDYTGTSVSSAGDINGDGFDDLIIGANYADPNGNPASGSSYVVYGGDFSNLVHKTGTILSEVMIGSDGADSISGGGGNDVLRSGAGDDLLTVADLTFRHIDGGNGTDRLILDTADQAFDFSNAAFQPGIRVVGIEEIDLGSTNAQSNNTLTINALQLLNLSDTSNELKVFGTDGDTVNLGFGFEAATSTDDAFNYYTSGQAGIYVDRDVAVNIALQEDLIV